MSKVFLKEVYEILSFEVFLVIIGFDSILTFVFTKAPFIFPNTTAVFAVCFQLFIFSDLLVESIEKL